MALGLASVLVIAIFICQPIMLRQKNNKRLRDNWNAYRKKALSYRQVVGFADNPDLLIFVIGSPLQGTKIL